MVKSYNRCYNHFNFSPVFSTFNFSKISFNSNTDVITSIHWYHLKQFIVSGYMRKKPTYLALLCKYLHKGKDKLDFSACNLKL